MYYYFLSVLPAYSALLRTGQVFTHTSYPRGNSTSTVLKAVTYDLVAIPYMVNIGVAWVRLTVLLCTLPREVT